MGDPEPVRVAIVAASGGSCAGKPTWETATNLLRTRLQRRFGERVSVEYIELFSPRSFELENVLNGIGDEILRLPVVLVNEQVLSSGTKLSERLLAQEVSRILQATAGGNSHRVG